MTTIKQQLDDSTTNLVPLTDNLIDKIRPYPARSLDPIVPHDLRFSGNTATSKLAVVRESLNKRSPRHDWIYILPTLPAIAWLLNIRCPGDIPYCPVAYAYLVLSSTQVTLLVDERKVGDELRETIKKDNVEIRPYGVEAVGKVIKGVVKSLKDGNEKKQVKLFAPKELSWALADVVAPVSSTGLTSVVLANPQSSVSIIPCPVDIAKAVKNPTEIKGFRKAYTRDGRAMVKWLAWLEDKLLNEKRPVGEWAAAQTLYRFRAQEEHFA